MCHQRTSFRCRFLCHQRTSFAAELCATSESVFAVKFCVTRESVFTIDFCVTSKLVSLPNFMSPANQFRCRILCHQRTNFRYWCSVIDFHIRIDLNACNEFIIGLCNIWNTWMWTCGFLKYVWWWVMWFQNANVLICDHWCVRWCDQDQTFEQARTPHGRNR
jgi:hypothetical protein